MILKVSQNLHASMLPYLIGAWLDKGSPDALQAGFDRERAMLERAGLDLTGAVQNDGAGGSALFSPDFMVRFLLHVREQPFFPAFLDALPVLGKDGTLVEDPDGFAGGRPCLREDWHFWRRQCVDPRGGSSTARGLRVS